MIERVAMAAFLLTPGVAWAYPSFWALSEPVLQGDGVDRGTAVTVDDVVIGDTEGLVTLRACCGLLDLAECQDSSTYEIAWALDREVDVLGRGDSVGVTLSNVRTSGICPDIDPTVLVAGDNGNPADSLPRLGVTFDGPVGIFDDALAGGRYYTTNSDPHDDHDNSVRTVSVYDTDTMLDDGYFHLDISHRWGLQYEITWLYGPTDDPDASKGCAHVGARGTTTMALLGLAAAIRRRRGSVPASPSGARAMNQTPTPIVAESGV